MDGKADMTNMSSTGKPTRLQSQLNTLEKQYPEKDITGEVIYQNKNISTKKIKEGETSYTARLHAIPNKTVPNKERHGGAKSKPHPETKFLRER